MDSVRVAIGHMIALLNAGRRACPSRSIRSGLIFISATIVTACATSPLGRSQLQLFSADAMAEMGAAAFDNLKAETKQEPDSRISRYVECVADNIVAALPQNASKWEVRVFQSNDLNAFALPGGKIGVYTGLLEAAQDQHQLATVIGHEVAHVLAEHGNERMSTTYAAEAGLQLAGALAGDPSSEQSRSLMALLGLGTQVGVLLPFSRAQEREADLLGLDLMARAGFDPAASLTLWQNMAARSGQRPPEFLSTHPGTDTRLGALQGRLPQAGRLRDQAVSQGRNPDCRR